MVIDGGIGRTWVHLKLEAKRRLSAGEFITLHEAQLAIAREHRMSSWAALKERVVDADSSRLSAKLAGASLRVEAGVEPEVPHRIDMLRFFPDGEETGLGWGLRRSMDAAGQAGTSS